MILPPIAFVSDKDDVSYGPHEILNEVYNYAVNPALYKYVENLPKPLQAPRQEYIIRGLNATWTQTWNDGVITRITIEDYIQLVMEKRLWVGDYYIVPDDNPPIGLYNKTPEEILARIEEVVEEDARAWSYIEPNLTRGAIIFTDTDFGK